MALTKVMTILVIFVLATPTFAQSNDHGHVSVLVSKTGLEFAKDYIIHKVISTTIPLQLPNIEKEVKIPIFGNVEMSLSNISIYSVDVHSSLIETGENGIVFSVTGAKANLSMDWSYTYRAAFFTESDHGDASVNVNGMDLKITVTLVSDNGSLKIASQASDCKVNNIDVHINGGASWLYQGMVNAFQKTIMSTVENTVSKKIIENMKKLDSLLQSIPKQRKIDEYAAVNLTFRGNPVLRNSSVEVGIDGLFFLPNGKVSESPSSPSLFSNVSKMVAVSIQEEVFNSATLVYFIAKRMHVNIEESKNGSLLSTSDWKLIIPEMYKQYPNDKMMLNMSVTSPPAVKVTKNGIGATIHLEIMLNVHDSGQVISVAHISSALNVACSARIAKKNLTGSLRLIDFNATMTSNKIGEPQSNYTQAATSRVLEALFLPYVNTHLNRGFPLQIPSSFMIENLDIVYVEGGVLVSSDIGTNLNYNTNI